MAPRRDQLTLEARLTVCPGAEIHLGCIRRTGIIWSYELRLSSTTCQNDRNEKVVYPSGQLRRLWQCFVGQNRLAKLSS